VDLSETLRHAVLELTNVTRPPNTVLAIQPKLDEFSEFCYAYFASTSYPVHVTYKKVYMFMFYQAFREKKSKRGRWRSGQPRFDKAACQELFGPYHQNSQLALNVEEFPLPHQPIGYSTFKQYRMAIKTLYDEQVQTNMQSTPWDHIWQKSLKVLEKHVRDRLVMVNRAQHKEKYNHSFAPYGMVEDYPKMESVMFENADSSHPRSLCTALRHRYCLLHLTSGILRCESLYRAELSDFFCLTHPKVTRDVHQPLLMISQISVGKINHGRLLYGRATRHQDVNLCPVGALAFYLQVRFHITGEFAAFDVSDWLSNEKWFDVKLLVDVQSTDTTKMMKKDSYGKAVKQMLAELGISCLDILHLGRKLGTKIGELFEAEQGALKNLGNWNLDIFDSAYSNKLPMNAIRTLAGTNPECYYVSRTAVDVPMELLVKTPMGSWCYAARDAVIEMGDRSKVTAKQTLMFFCELNKVFVQDAAAMMIKESEKRSSHALFEYVPCFASEEFEVRLIVLLCFFLTTRELTLFFPDVQGPDEEKAGK